MDSKFPLLPKVINGSIAGIVGVTCVFPIDLAKTRLQNQQAARNGQLLYRNLFDCFIKIYRAEGFLGMYRGSGVNLLLITPEKAIKLVCNDYFRHRLKNDQNKLTMPREVVAGAGAGLCQIIVTTPMELLKIQLQDAGRTSVNSGTVGTASRLSATSVAMNLVKEKGLTGLYKGCKATLLRDVTFSAVYFPLFAHLNSKGKRKKNSTEAVFFHSLLSGFLAGCVASLLVNPFDVLGLVMVGPQQKLDLAAILKTLLSLLFLNVVKTRLQTLKKARGEQSYTGVMDCFMKVYSKEGPKAFFKGGLCRILVIGPLFGIAQSVYYFGVAEFLLSKLPSSST